MIFFFLTARKTKFEYIIEIHGIVQKLTQIKKGGRGNLSLPFELNKLGPIEPLTIEFFLFTPKRGCDIFHGLNFINFSKPHEERWGNYPVSIEAVCMLGQHFPGVSPEKFYIVS